MGWRDNRQKALRERAELVIPGGMYGHESTRLLPSEFPQFFRRASGSRIWDCDDNEYIDYMCAYGPNLFGYQYEPIEGAALRQRALGDTMTGPSEVMVDLAEQFVRMVTHAEWALFCKNGTDATTTAMMIARAYSGRRKILVAQGAYHGAMPWCTPVPYGTVPEDRAHAVYYTYNDAQSLSDTYKAHAGDVAAIFATPFRHEVFSDQFLPSQEYAKLARDLCDRFDSLLIVDDVRAGLRIARDCSWTSIGVQPDLSAWGKCIANGHPISAVLGSNRVREAAAKIFVTGSFWFSAVPMAAAIETLNQVRQTDYLERLNASGRLLREGLDAQAKTYGFALRQTGPVSMPQILFEDDPDFRLGYGWVTECLKRGVYMSPYHNMFLSAAHEAKDIGVTLTNTDSAFSQLKRNRSTLMPHPVVEELIAMAQS